MDMSNPTPSSLPDAAVDSSPLLPQSFSDHLIRSRRFIRNTPPPLRTAARFFRRASGRRMMLREPSVRVRETAAEQLEERQSNWAYSKPVIILDILWNTAFLAIGLTVLGLSMKEKPSVPLRLWIVGYLLQGVIHCVCVIVEYKRRRITDSSVVEESTNWESGGDSYFSSGSDGDDSATEQHLDDNDNSITKHLESANTMLSFIWWIIGFYWVTAGGQNLTRESPQLYWLCITFLAFDIVIVLICVAVACLVGIAVCCCLPCILAILYIVADQLWQNKFVSPSLETVLEHYLNPKWAGMRECRRSTKEEIDQLPKYKFRRVDEHKKGDGDVQESYRGKGIMTKCDSDMPTEHVLFLEDAECCICLSAYDDDAELRELPCNHHFHCNCVDKWLHLNATCPLCKYNILRTGSQQEV